MGEIFTAANLGGALHTDGPGARAGRRQRHLPGDRHAGRPDRETGTRSRKIGLGLALIGRIIMVLGVTWLLGLDGGAVHYRLGTRSA